MHANVFIWCIGCRGSERLRGVLEESKNVMWVVMGDVNDQDKLRVLCNHLRRNEEENEMREKNV